MIILAHDGHGRLKLDGRCELELNVSKETENGDGHGDFKERETSLENRVKKETKKGRVVVVGYKKHKRLRTLPPQYVQARTIRMSYEDS